MIGRPLTNDGAVTSQRKSGARGAHRPQCSDVSPTFIGKEPNQHSARTLVYEMLLTAIMTCAMEPGAGLSEKSISHAYGVSRTPVGEALQQLATEGLVIIRPQQRTVVARIRAGRIRESCFIAELVGRIAVSEAMELAIHSEREPLSALLRQQLASAKSGNAADYISLERRFYTEIAGLSGLESLREIWRLAQAHLARLVALSSTNSGAMMDWAGDNDELLSGLQLGDAERAARALRSRSKRAARLLPHLAAHYPSYFDTERGRHAQLELDCLQVAMRSGEE